MAIFSVEITDTNLAGITAARENYNASLPEGGQKIDTDEIYFSARANDMVASWAILYLVSDSSQAKAKDDFIASLPSDKRDAVSAALAAVIPDAIVSDVVQAKMVKG